MAALTEALERMVTDAALRVRLARQGRAFVMSRFDWNRATERLEGILRAGGSRGDRRSA